MDLGSVRIRFGCDDPCKADVGGCPAARSESPAGRRSLVVENLGAGVPLLPAAECLCGGGFPDLEMGRSRRTAQKGKDNKS